MSTLYDRLGGSNTMDAIVETYFEKVMADPTLKHFFSKTNMQTLKIKYKMYLTSLMGGKQNYPGQNVKTALHQYHIQKHNFDDTWTHMQQALNQHKIAEKLIKEMKKVFFAQEKEVVNVQYEKQKSLFARLGGQPIINVVVEKFYDLILKDPLISHFFANTDMKKQAHRQKQFMAMITGGPNKYEGADVRTAHKKMKIGKKEFDQFWHHLEKALSLYKVNQAEIKEFRNIIYSMQEEVVYE